MNTVNFGPLSIQAVHILLLISLIIAAGVGHLAGRRDKVGIASVLIDMTLVAMVSGRVAFVAAWFEQYWKSPLTMLDVRDGGFIAWVGISCALAFGVWRAYQQAPLRNPLAAGVLAGAMAWFMSGASGMMHVQTEKTVPKVVLARLDGSKVDLPDVARGRPAVINIWATWCPPCIREMPVLADAQQRDTDINFIFANTGESAETVAAFLHQRGLQLNNVLLDPTSATAKAVGSSGTPTTLFFDARGQLVDAHLGPLSEASLAAKLATIRGTGTQ